MRKETRELWRWSSKCRLRAKKKLSYKQHQKVTQKIRKKRVATKKNLSVKVKTRIKKCCLKSRSCLRTV